MALWKFMEISSAASITAYVFKLFEQWTTVEVAKLCNGKKVGNRTPYMYKKIGTISIFQEHSTLRSPRFSFQTQQKRKNPSKLQNSNKKEIKFLSYFISGRFWRKNCVCEWHAIFFKTISNWLDLSGCLWLEIGLKSKSCNQVCPQRRSCVSQHLRQRNISEQIDWI